MQFMLLHITLLCSDFNVPQGCCQISGEIFEILKVNAYNFNLILVIWSILHHNRRDLCIWDLSSDALMLAYEDSLCIKRKQLNEII